MGLVALPMADGPRIFATPFVVGEKVRREKPLDFGGCNSRPQTGSLHHPVAEAATSSFDVLKRGAISECVDAAEGG
jgi:hypothetical protein